MKCIALVLAAGEGTRMESERPKVLHELAGRPLIGWVVGAVKAATEAEPYVVVQPGADALREAMGAGVDFIIQAQPLGTGHAVAQAQPDLASKADLVLVTYSDMPLIAVETYRALVSTQEANQGPLTILTVRRDHSRGFGRVLRDGAGEVMGIVEEVDATPEQLSIREFNVGAYCFRAEWLWQAVSQLRESASGEYYLTDLIELAVSQGQRVGSVAVIGPEEAIGINTRVHLAEAEAVVRRRINVAWMSRGVTLQDPGSTYIGPQVQLARDVVILANTHLEGRTQVGVGTRIGPNSIVRDSVIGERCAVIASYLQGASMGDDVSVGPFARLRQGARLEDGVYMGNFGEVKNSTLAPGVKAGHFCYLGDAMIGPDVNIGAGTITCNFDGKRKHKTVIEEGAFIGSDTMLIAPVRIGEGAHTGAGAVVNRDVPPHSVAVGAPARVIRRIQHADE
jgi:bifunctional UDP-N-acetylglucosamine pyrophosphorylase/glucosamine-1-phosphate N-acetyltransferase